MNIYKTILVTGANGDLAISIGRALLEILPNVILHGADLGAIWPGKSIFSKMHTLPRADHLDYRQQFDTLNLNNNFDLIIPASTQEIQYFAENWESAKSFPLLMNKPQFILPFLDKLETANWLHCHGIEVPYTVLITDADPAKLPLITKPQFGSGSKNIENVETVDHLKHVQNTCQIPTVAQERLDPANQEYTCVLFKHAQQKRSFVMRRKLLGGITSEFTVVKNEAIDALIDQIGSIEDFEGILNIQLRLTKNGPRIFEINPRLSSTVMMRHQAGFRDLEWLLFSRQNKVIPEFKSIPGQKVFRLDQELVVQP